MLINGLGIGVPYGTSGGGSGGSGSILATSSLYLPLKTTIVPTRGASTPTFTRATAAWDFDNEGKLNLNIPSGCPRFTGARLVRNLILSPSNDISSFTKTNTTTPSANVLQAVAGDAPHYAVRNSTTTGSLGQVYTVYCRLQKNNHRFAQLSFTSGTFGTSIYLNIDLDTGVYNLYGASQAQITLVSTGVWDIQFYAEVTTAGSTPGFVVGLITALDSGRLSNLNAIGTESVDILQFAYYNVSGEADYLNQTYISVGVLSAPFHGAGVDGCKYFNTNKNGSAISPSVLKKYLAEPSRVNNCLWGRDQRGQTAFGTVKPWIPSIVGSELITNGGFDSDTTWVKGSGWSIGSGVATKTAGVASDLSQTISVVSGKSYVITYTLTRTAGNLFIRVGGSSGNLYISPTTNGTYTTCVIAAGGSSVFYFGADSAFAGTIDNISVKEAAIQVTQTTGLDNVANSASRLTAAANDATLLQLLTAATGTRTTSVWIKRVSGSGTVSLTRNGGTGWTDITSSLVTGTWVPVELTSDVGANPTVGLKMGTSGDVIDVDCFQDENGAWRTSPILTTTAAVTRNADVLSYASAFDVAQGTALCSVKSDCTVGNGGILALNGDGGNAKIMYWNSATARTGGSCFDGSVAVSATGMSINTGIRKRASRWGADLRACADGTLGAPGAFDGGMGATPTLFVGVNQSSASQLSGNIGEVHVWNAPLTDAQMQQVTT